MPRRILDLNVEEIRRDFPITETCIYFNTGWSGPSPIPVVKAMEETLRRGASIGPASNLFLSEMEEELVGLRRDLGELLGVETSEIALTHSTGEGLNIVYNGIDWKKGDRVITTNLEHPANDLPLMQLKRRHGVEMIRVKADPEGLIDPEDLERAIDGKTRLITISHVIYMLGTILPIKEITKIAHENGIPVLLDMAQSVGCINFDLKDLGCDFAAARGGKWLLGPGGTGFLYVDLERLDDLNMASIGYRGAQIEGDSYRCYPEARRFEISEPNNAINVGLRRAVQYNKEIGSGTIEKYIRGLARYLIEKAEDLSSLRVLGTQDLTLKNGLVTIEVQGRDAVELVPLLEKEYGIVARAIPRFNGVRFSLHIFNTEKEIDRLISTLNNL